MDPLRGRIVGPEVGQKRAGSAELQPGLAPFCKVLRYGQDYFAFECIIVAFSTQTLRSGAPLRRFAQVAEHEPGLSGRCLRELGGPLDRGLPGGGGGCCSVRPGQGA